MRLTDKWYSGLSLSLAFLRHFPFASLLRFSVLFDSVVPSIFPLPVTCSCNLHLAHWEWTHVNYSWPVFVRSLRSLFRRSSSVSQDLNGQLVTLTCSKKGKSVSSFFDSNVSMLRLNGFPKDQASMRPWRVVSQGNTAQMPDFCLSPSVSDCRVRRSISLYRCYLLKGHRASGYKCC